MAVTETQPDGDTLQKVELINRKIDEINQRKMGIHTTALEDDLDRQELEAYIGSLQLTEEQRRLVDRCNRNKERPVRVGNEWIVFIIMTAGIFLQFYIGFEIYRLISKGSLVAYEAAYLGLLVLFFLFNAFQMLRYMRIVR
ncbi:MAG: hypothetical protein A4E28_02242 [Methanocella sp. PtaU1.Bin125]|nr:MAG: hypothetical protein A4E28_02242 [Methanocella sp. PtaU1.Bin125]